MKLKEGVYTREYKYCEGFYYVIIEKVFLKTNGVKGFTYTPNDNKRWGWDIAIDVLTTSSMEYQGKLEDFPELMI